MSRCLLSLLLLAFVASFGPHVGRAQDGDGQPDDPPPAQPRPNVTVAVCGPMTGAAAAFGDRIRKAAQLYASQLNDAGGVDIDGTAHDVRAEIYDDRGSAASSVQVSRSVASNKSIVAVVGHFNSVCSLAAKNAYRQHKLVHVSPGSTNVHVTQGSPYSFRILYDDPWQGAEIADYLATVRKLGKVAVLYDNDDYGKELADAFGKRAAEVDLEVVASIPYLRGRTQDFREVVRKAREAKAEALVVAGLYMEGGLIAKACGDLDYRVPIFGGDGLMADPLIEAAGEHAGLVEGVTVPFAFDADRNSPSATAFFNAYQEAYGTEPDCWAALTWDAVALVVTAIGEVGADRQKIRDWIAGRKDADSAFAGITGAIWFEPNGDCHSRHVWFMQVKDGEWVVADKQLPE